MSISSRKGEKRRCPRRPKCSTTTDGDVGSIVVVETALGGWRGWKMGGRGGGGFLACGRAVCVVCGVWWWWVALPKARDVQSDQTPTRLAQSRPHRSGGRWCRKSSSQRHWADANPSEKRSQRKRRITECGRGGRRRGEVSRSRVVLVGKLCPGQHGRRKSFGG
jgi:hypothetical protein